MRMVDTEDGDILVLTDLVREESGLSQNSHDSTLSSNESSSQVISILCRRSYQILTIMCRSSFPNHSTPISLPRADSIYQSMSSHVVRSISCFSPSSVNDIELLEEIEDRIALGQSSQLTNSVHFRSRYIIYSYGKPKVLIDWRDICRLSLIPEQIPSTVEEGEEPSDDSHPLSLEDRGESNDTLR
uniref:Cauli_VI domain-containing protein n=1 Tax=Heterorhabditis bacteriophora TaxID=37862 RepID=A0A1I7XMK5_HETBA